MGQICTGWGRVSLAQQDPSPPVKSSPLSPDVPQVKTAEPFSRNYTEAKTALARVFHQRRQLGRHFLVPAGLLGGHAAVIGFRVVFLLRGISSRTIRSAISDRSSVETRHGAMSSAKCRRIRRACTSARSKCVCSCLSARVLSAGRFRIAGRHPRLLRPERCDHAKLERLAGAACAVQERVGRFSGGRAATWRFPLKSAQTSGLFSDQGTPPVLPAACRSTGSASLSAAPSGSRRWTAHTRRTPEGSPPANRTGGTCLDDTGPGSAACRSYPM